MIIQIDDDTRIKGTSRCWELQRRRNYRGGKRWEPYKWFSTFRQALDEARSTLAACLMLHGAAPSTGGRRQRAVRPAQGKQVNVKAVLKHVASNPGSRCAQIAEALGAESKAVSPALKDLKAQGWRPAQADCVHY